MPDKKKYPGYRTGGHSSDDHFRSKGEMTNNEFFTSNASGGFYSGMKYDDESKQWVLNDFEQSKADARYEANKCTDCGGQKPYCECW